MRALLGAARLRVDARAAAAARPVHVGGARAGTQIHLMPVEAPIVPDAGPRRRARRGLRGDARRAARRRLRAHRGQQRVGRAAHVRALSGRAPRRGHVAAAAPPVARRRGVASAGDRETAAWEGRQGREAPCGSSSRCRPRPRSSSRSSRCPRRPASGTATSGHGDDRGHHGGRGRATSAASAAARAGASPATP